MKTDDASTSTLGILGALMMAALTLTFAHGMSSSPPTGKLEDRSLQQQAELLAHLMFAEGAVERGSDWQTSPDAFDGFNLMIPRGDGRLDADALTLLARGAIDSQANGAPDYADVKASLGLAYDFHVTVTPIAPPLGDAAWEPLPLRVAYFGHYSGARAPAAATTTIDASSSALNVSVNLTNRATFPAVFTINVAIGDAASGKVLVSQDRHTTLLGGGAAEKVWVQIPALDPWTNKANALRVSITDPYGNPATDADGAPIPTPWLPVAMPTTAPAAYGLILQAANPYYVAGADVNFDVESYDGKGARVGGASTRFVLTSPNGTTLTNQTLTLGAQGQTTWSCTNCTMVGNYTARALDASGATIATERIHVSGARMFTEKRTPDAVATNEIQLLDALVESFDTTRFDAATGAGDVFGDDVNGPTELPGVIGRYDIIVIGSEASHHALSPADVKRGITTWVDAGGTLVVFGTSQEPSRWLQSEYGLALAKAPGTPTAPDADHPVLSHPEALDYARYLYRSRAWQIPAGDGFDRVLSLSGDTSGASSDALAISRQGAFGNGTVILTSYLPGALTADGPDAEASRLLHNLLSHRSGRLVLDYGPPIPNDVPVSAASRVLVAARTTEGDVGVVKVVVHVFRR